MFWLNNYGSALAVEVCRELDVSEGFGKVDAIASVEIGVIIQSGEFISIPSLPFACAVAAAAEKYCRNQYGY